MYTEKRNLTRPNSDLAVLESPMEWLETFQQGWLAALEKTGRPDWDKYQYPVNQLAPSGKGIDLARSRLLLISTAGGYLKDEQQAFNAGDVLGDYSTRLIPIDTEFSRITIAHEHYEHQSFEADPQVLLPLHHLQEMQAAGEIGELAPVMVSYSGYQPNVIRIAKELVPAVVKVAKELDVQAALLVPSWPLCIQSVGLVARALEVEGVATTLVSWSAKLASQVAPPRYAVVQGKRGSTLGEPGDAAGQRQVLKAALDLLAQNAPLDMVTLNGDKD